MITTTILAKVEAGRLQKAVEGLVSGAYHITLTGQSETEVRGFVANGDGKEYGMVLTEEHAFCSCPDAMYRKVICKHAVVLALYVIRMSQPEVETEEARPVNLKLGKVRKGFAFSA
jgi:predicted nucleic acid-binding Zn finger protein